MELSKRLYAVAGLVTEGASVADVGTDHGYIPIYLIEQQIAVKAIALDVNGGPLERARMHIVGHGLKEKIETRMSDGLSALKPGEVDTMIAAGMGGGLIIRILEEGKEIVDTLKACVLQPQSEVWRVRKYLLDHHMDIIEEDMVEEEGKFYPMMRAVRAVRGEPPQYTDWEYIFGKCLLEKRHPVLERFLHRELEIREGIFRQLNHHVGSESALQRREEIRREMMIISRALGCYCINSGASL
ncbi:MAG: SAM-dependent methyltransferase [Dorea sp.]|nr:SAM-dependent methyltransferase [Dorea sp.]